MRTFGEILAEKMRARGLSQRKLARVLDVTPMTVSQWVRGVTYPNLLTACDIADYFGCALDELVDRKVKL